MNKWEYLKVVVDRVQGQESAVRSLNGKEQPDWQAGPSVYTTLNQLGEQGWELVAAAECGRPFLSQLLFKRAK